MLNEDFKAAMTIERFKLSGIIGIFKTLVKSDISAIVTLCVRERARARARACMCMRISFTTTRPWAIISLLSQLDAAAPESSYPLGDKPVSQPALFQTLVGHSVIVIRRVCVCSLVSNFISRHL